MGGCDGHPASPLSTNPGRATATQSRYQTGRDMLSSHYWSVQVVSGTSIRVHGRIAPPTGPHTSTLDDENRTCASNSCKRFTRIRNAWVFRGSHAWSHH